MSLLLPATTAAGFNETTDVRTVIIDGVRMVSVLDIIKTAIGGSLNAREYWSRISKAYRPVGRVEDTQVLRTGAA